jgi:ATP-dependent DNA ligase
MVGKFPLEARAEVERLPLADTATSHDLDFIKPEIPTLVPEPPTGDGWIHEIKYDGYRTLIVIDRGQVRAVEP